MDCPICFENVSTGERKLGCNHVFHAACISKWLEKAHTCPVCRAAVAADLDVVPMSVVLSRFMRVLREYSSATDPAEKTYKLESLFRMIRKHSLEYDMRVHNALNTHGINFIE